jgi:hypothetical protein
MATLCCNLVNMLQDEIHSNTRGKHPVGWEAGVARLAGCLRVTCRWIDSKLWSVVPH